jgi:hypothetical protein
VSTPRGSLGNDAGEKVAQLQGAMETIDISGLTAQAAEGDHTVYVGTTSS